MADPLLDFASTFAAALAASGVVGAIVDTRAEKRLKGAEDIRSDIDRALDALAALRDAYRTRALNDAGEEITVARLEDALGLAALCSSEAVIHAAREYVRVGQLYSVRDPDNGEDEEQAAFDALALALVAERKAYA